MDKSGTRTNGAISGSRCSNWNNYPWYSYWYFGLRFSKWSIGHVSYGLDWLGYRIWPTHKLLRKQSVISAKRKIIKYRARGDALSLQRFIASWQGHAQWADSFNLLNKLGVAR